LFVASSVDNAKNGLGERCCAFRKECLGRIQEKCLLHVGGFIVSSNTILEISGHVQYGIFHITKQPYFVIIA